MGLRPVAVLALLAAVLAVFAAKPQPANATWNVVAAYNGTNEYTDPQTGDRVSEPWAQNGANLGTASWFYTGGESITTGGTVTITFTWEPQPKYIPVQRYAPLGPDENEYEWIYDADDAPETVRVQKNAWAFWNIPTTFGLGGPPPGDPGYVPLNIHGSASTSPSGPYFSDAVNPRFGGTSGSEVVTKSGSSFTVVFSINVTVTSDPNTCAGGRMETSAGCSATVIPEQYGFREVFSENEGNGATENCGLINVLYLWSCTTGNLADLPPNARVYEHITFTGTGSAGVDRYGVPSFIPKSPPFLLNEQANPTDPLINGHGISVPASFGELRDFFGRPLFNANSNTGRHAHEGNYTGTQVYRIVDDAFGYDVNNPFATSARPRPVKLAPGTPATHQIVRKVEYAGPDTDVVPNTPYDGRRFKYTITRDGLESWLLFL